MQVASLAAMTSSPRGLRLQFGDGVLRAAAQIQHLLGVIRRRSCPAVVSEMRLPKRSNRSVRSSCSSWRTCALMAGCVR